MSGAPASGPTLSAEISREAQLLALLPRSEPAAAAADGRLQLLKAFEAGCASEGLKTGAVSVALKSVGFNAIVSVEDEAAAAGYAALALLVAPSGSSAMIGLDHAAVQLTLTAMFGSEVPDEAEAGRPLTGTEYRIARIVAEDIRTIAASLGIPGLADAELKLLATMPEKDDFANLQPALKLNATLQFAEHTGSIALYLPIKDVDATVEEAPAPAAKLPGWENTLRGHIGKLRIRVSAVLPPVRRTLSEISALRPGDVIDLAPIGDTQTVFVKARNRTIFSGELGKIGRSYSVRIMQPVTEAP